MKVKSLRFSHDKEQKDFVTVLRRRVDSYFEKSNKSKFGNFHITWKVIFMLSVYFIPLVLMFTGVVTNVWVSMLMFIIMGLGLSGIGLSIMHDANHGSMSKYKWLNNMLGSVLYLVGSSSAAWKVQHNVLHHSFTNIHGMDEDIETVGMLRFSPHTKKKGIHKLQAFYAVAFYSLMTLYWVTAKDFVQLTGYQKRNLFQRIGVNITKEWIVTIISKSVYVIYMIVLPILFTPLLWWQVLIGFVVLHLVSGITLALIFQSAHVLEETSFPLPDDKGNLENVWAVHQLYTTANFATSNPVLSWLIGGLNFQIEHHLFPDVCHVHYKKISKIVKQTANEYGLPYHEHNTFPKAIASHFRFLNRMGNVDYIPDPAKVEQK